MQYVFTRKVMVDGVAFEAGSIIEQNEIHAGNLASALYVGAVAEHIAQPPEIEAPKPAAKKVATHAGPAKATGAA